MLTAQERSLAAAHGVRVLTLEDADYPQRFKTLPDPPSVLYVRGTLTDADETAVAIVGTRRPSVYGLQCARRLSTALAERGLTVVSGLARGIDAAAHEGALAAGGRTIAVLGSGLARCYPPEHAGLAQRIARQGAVVSEFSMEAEPLAYHFPRRNRLISGLSLGVVVVEAARRSGALITADCALEQGREVFAVPGPMEAVTSQGTHQLLQQGAKLVTSVEDILEELRLRPVPSGVEGVPVPVSAALAGGASASEPERRILSCLRDGTPRDIETIVTESGLELPMVSSLLTQLALRRLIRQLPGQRFVRGERGMG